MRGFRRGEPMGWGWRVVAAIAYPPVSLAFKIRCRHMDRMPQRGGVIIVTNHVSHVDPLIVSKFILDAGRTPRFMAKEAIFEVPVVDAAMRAMQHIPVRRETSDAGEALAAAVEKLRKGHCVVLHPEGTVTRDPDYWPMSAKTGVARLWLLFPEVPIIPLAQWGVQEQIDFYRKKKKFLPRAKHTISVGEPVDLSRFKQFSGAAPTPETLREVTDVIMKRLRSDVAELRGVPAPTGELFVWARPRPVDAVDKKASDKDVA